jgi:hypothetical protein
MVQTYFLETILKEDYKLNTRGTNIHKKHMELHLQGQSLPSSYFCSQSSVSENYHHWIGHIHTTMIGSYHTITNQQTEDALTSVLPYGVSGSELQPGVTSKPRIETISSSSTLHATSVSESLGYNWGGEVGDGSPRPFSCDLTRLRRTPLGWECFMTTMLHCMSALERVARLGTVRWSAPGV